MDDLDELQINTRICLYVEDEIDPENLKIYAATHQRVTNEFFTARCYYDFEKAYKKVASYELGEDLSEDFAITYYEDAVRLLDSVHKKRESLEKALQEHGFADIWLGNEIERNADYMGYDIQFLNELEWCLCDANKMLFEHLQMILLKMRNETSLRNVDPLKIQNLFKEVTKWGFEGPEISRDEIDLVVRNIIRQLRVLSYLRARICIEAPPERKSFIAKSVECVPLLRHIVFDEGGDLDFAAAMSVALKGDYLRDRAIIKDDAPDDTISLIAAFAYNNMEDMCISVANNLSEEELRARFENSYMSILAAMIESEMYRMDSTIYSLFHPVSFYLSNIVYNSVIHVENLWAEEEEREKQAPKKRTKRCITEHDRQQLHSDCVMVKDLLVLTLLLPFAAAYYIINLPLFLLTLVLAIPIGISNFIANLIRGKKKKK
ncbi:hypothetical protein [Anaerobiospirillum succiniciproducens]|uniref:hypothetical protein n=1 Tax=Anaerobiospirillum succiniciproducens TaxID=13335 RepID=UPI00040B2A65|nr:hypothetical protein [Anaerobiospirillum succiniciproducens]